MRRYQILVIVVTVVTAVLALQAVAQEVEPEALDAAGTTTPLTEPLFGQMVAGQWEAVELEPLAPDEIADINPAAQYCAEATTLNIPEVGSGGGQTTVNGAIEEPDDPVLSCTVGVPPGPRGQRGYRTVWYKFTAPITGRVVIEAEPNADYQDNYDTIIGVFSGDCGASLVQVTCSDDNNGFLSRATATVIAGQTYYVEIADWQLGVSGDAILNLSAYIDASEVGVHWQQAGAMAVGRSRHAVVMVGEYAYVIAGQTSAAGNPVRTGHMDRYNTVTGEWTQVQSLPATDALGYSNTMAAYKDGRIYVPSGYVGDENNYDGTHWFYDIATDHWDVDTPIPSPHPPAAYMAGAALPGGAAAYFVSGGITGPVFVTTTSTVLNDVWTFLPNPEGGPGVWLDQPDLSVARYAHTAAYVNGRMCVVGGIGDGGNFHVLLSGGECYNAPSWQPIGSLNEARFNAGSAVAPDGRWYVFGGTAADGSAVNSTEVYNPATNAWTKLDFRFDLAEPARSWPRGGFAGNNLWVFGGETAPGAAVVPLVEKLFVPNYQQGNFLPVMFSQLTGASGGDTFHDASFLALNVPEYHRFDTISDYFDLFYFELDSERPVWIKLSDVPNGANYDLEIYNANKFRHAAGSNPILGAGEEIPLTLLPGRYYVMVIRAFPLDTPPEQPYRIEVVDG